MTERPQLAGVLLVVASLRYWQGQRFFHFFHDDIALRLTHVRQLEQDVAEQLAVAGHLVDARLHQVVEVAGHQVAFEHVRQLEHGAAELFESIAGLVVQADLDEHQQVGLEVLRVEAGVVAHDDAFALQAPHALGAGGGRQAHAFTQFGEADASVLLQDAEDVAVDLVQFTATLMLGSHGESASVKRLFAKNSRQI